MRYRNYYKRPFHIVDYEGIPFPTEYHQKVTARCGQSVTYRYEFVDLFVKHREWTRGQAKYCQACLDSLTPLTILQYTEL